MANTGNKPHLCYFIDTHVIGGTERYLVDLVNAMNHEGFRVTVICHHFTDLLDFFKTQMKFPGDVISCPLPSITRNAHVQAALTLNRSAQGAFNFLKIPGLLYF